jgi:hypothetical protein
MQVIRSWSVPVKYLDKFVSNKKEASDVIQVSIKNSAAVKYNETKGKNFSFQKRSFSAVLICLQL